MPELPEVETVCRGIRPHIVGRQIAEVTLRRADIRMPIPQDLPQQLEGATITKVDRRAKYILLYTDRAYICLIHLGMSGRLMLQTNMPNRLEKHDHVIVRLNDGQVLIFNDPRRFGVVTGFAEDALAAHPLIAHLGPEPLGEAFDTDYLYKKCQNRKSAIKPVLMDQKLVVGVGNIYASEALHQAGVNPERSANKISKAKYNQIVTEIRDVLGAAIASGGSTLRNYVDSRGEAGYFQHRFLVYNKESEPCAACGQKISRIVQCGRSTFFCKKCQK